MKDPLPVAELEAASPARSPIPFLWLAVVMLVTGALAALFSGAADDEPDAPPEARLAAAADAAAAVDFAFSATSSFEGQGEDNASTFTLVGAYDVETGRIRATVDTPGSPVELIQDDGIQYLRFPAGQSGVFGTGTKPWVRMDVRAMLADDPAASSSAFGQNPLDTFARLGEITGPIERVGEEQVRGVATVHFRTTVDASRRARTGASPAAVASLKNVLVEVWLDDDDRPRRHRETMTLAADKAKTVSTMESFDFGRPVTIDLPPEDQVEDFDLSSIRTNLDALTTAKK